jgi:FlaA1/EpsC-like NDP-sugar epimerase
MQFIRNKIIHFFNTRYDGYILITKHMNSIVNPNNKPCIIMEGLVDNFMVDVNNQYDKKDKERILLYAGMIYERYGIKTLIEAFIRIKDLDIRLDIYALLFMFKNKILLITGGTSSFGDAVLTRFLNTEIREH